MAQASPRLGTMGSKSERDEGGTFMLRILLSSTVVVVVAAGASVSLSGCAHQSEAAAMPSLAIAAEAVAAEPSKPAPLFVDHFKTDTTASITEDELRKILNAPVFLEDR